jgi:hypothetical protein
MKSSIKGLFVILAIVMSFALVQGVYARDMEKVTKDSFTGEVTSVDETNRSITLDLGTDEDGDGVTDSITIFGMGPSWYWEDVLKIDYSSLAGILDIAAFKCDNLEVWVGISVCLSSSECNESDLIKLRDATTLQPLWNPNAKTTDLSDTAAEASGDDKPNDYSHDYDYNYDYNYNWKDEEPGGPHGK